MLGVFKKRWKTKKSGNSNNSSKSDEKLSVGDSGGGSATLYPLPVEDHHHHHRFAASTRSSASIRHQVHPRCDEKSTISSAYDTKLPPNFQYHQQNGGATTKSEFLLLQHHANSLPAFTATDYCLPHQEAAVKRASFDGGGKPTITSPTSIMAPNICVEGGRIEFVRQQQQTGGGGRVTITRGQQTDDQLDVEQMNRIQHLEAALVLAEQSQVQDKQTIAKLQKQLTKRESIQRDADRERRLRADSESRTKQALQETTRCRSRLKLLTTEFYRMEETVRSMLSYKKQVEQLRQEKAALTLAFENRCQQYQTTINRLNQEIATLKQQLDDERFGSPCHTNEEDILNVQRQVEDSCKQYDRCLDDVANQVVKALLAQKGLREEVIILNGKIHDLESQNRTLTSMLVGQMHNSNGSTSPSKSRVSNKSHFSPNEIKHCTSFDSQAPLSNCSLSSPEALPPISTSSFDIFDLESRFSLEDKKRHQILTKLWTELKGAEVTPKKLIEALNRVDPALWVAPKRPVSLNLHLPVLQAACSVKYRRSRPILGMVQPPSGGGSSKSEEETSITTTATAPTTGNESPESSGNRDEGYSTMSSDVQAVEAAAARPLDGVPPMVVQPNIALEDLKEEPGGIIDEALVQSRLLLTDQDNPDILYIPLNLLNLNLRHSYPPAKGCVPFQHVMRSFSDSNLCIKITTATTPTLSNSYLSSSSSIFLLGINPPSGGAADPPKLRRTHATNTLYTSSVESPSANKVEVVGGGITTWDAEYIQHWLRLDETRATLQQHQRDLLELEYEHDGDVEDWSLNLSANSQQATWCNGSVRGGVPAASTPIQVVGTGLPSIQESDGGQEEEEGAAAAAYVLWTSMHYRRQRDELNSSSAIYLLEEEVGGADGGLGVEGEEEEEDTASSIGSSSAEKWPYTESNGRRNHPQMQSPEDVSWSSSGGGSSNTPIAAAVTATATTTPTPGAGDGYSISKRSSAALSDETTTTTGGDLSAIGTDFTRDFYRLVKFESTKSLASTSSRSIAGYCCGTEYGVDAETAARPKVSNSPPPHPSGGCGETGACDIYVTTNELCLAEKNVEEANNYITLKQLQHAEQQLFGEQSITYAEQVCLVQPLDVVESGTCLNIVSEHAAICCSSLVNGIGGGGGAIMETPPPVPRISRIPRRSSSRGSRPLPALQHARSAPSPHRHSRIPKSRVLHGGRRSAPLTPLHASYIIDGPPERAVSFHERATTKDVINELNRMIRRNGSDDVIGLTNTKDDQNGLVDDGMCDANEGAESLDVAGRPTGWVHLERDIDLSDPKARANLLDVMMAASIGSSDSASTSPTSSCGGSITSDYYFSGGGVGGALDEPPPDYGHLHRIHKFHRQKKANAVRSECSGAAAAAVVRASQPITRPSIIGRSDFYVRYGEKEMEAVASFDFLDELSSATASSGGGSLEDTAFKEAVLINKNIPKNPQNYTDNCDDEKPTKMEFRTIFTLQQQQPLEQQI